MKPLLAALALCLAAPLQAQTLTFVGEVALRTNPTTGLGGSDVWPYTAPDGSEYALMGDVSGVSVVAVPSLEVVAHIAGPSAGDVYYHRDIKTLGDYAYIVTECFGGDQEGLQVVDLSGLPTSVSVRPSVHGVGDRLHGSHNFTIDRAAGFAYVMSNDARQVVLVDLSDPGAPVDVGAIDFAATHDVYAHADRLYVAEGSQPTFSIWDTTDKSAPVLLSRTAIPNAGYVHNIWPTADGRYAVTTEETQGKTVKVWDLADVAEPELVGEWLGASQLAHNAHIVDRYAFISHYASGVSVVDVADPAAPVEVASYDTYPSSDQPGFVGAWGATLPSPGGYVYVSDLEGDLTVLQWAPAAVDAEAAPRGAELLGAPLPNPTTGGATVTLSLASAATATVTVLDLRGRALARVVRSLGAGAHAVALPTAGLPAGVYVVRAEADGQVQSRRLTVARP